MCSHFVNLEEYLFPRRSTYSPGNKYWGVFISREISTPSGLNKYSLNQIRGVLISQKGTLYPGNKYWGVFISREISTPGELFFGEYLLTVTPFFSVFDLGIHSSFGLKILYRGTVKFANSANTFTFRQVKIPLKSCS